MFRLLLLSCLIIYSSFALSNDTDSLPGISDDRADIQTYLLKDGSRYTYQKPKFLNVFTDIPNDFYQFGKTTVSSQGLKCLGLVALSTLAILPFDQKILDKSHQFGNSINLESERRFAPLLSINGLELLQYPQNINTTFYYLGEGLPSLLIGAGLMSYGYYNNNYRALSTAFQLYEAFIVLGLTTQLIKRVSGRESPFVATQNGGKWSGFPGFKEYQSHIPHYDAFPSGHLTTVMATITILSENYPDNRYIKPVGYSLMGLIGYSMLHNKVHWFSDYPLALAIGYAFGKIISNRHIKKSGINNSRVMISPSINSFGNPGVSLRYRLN